MRRFIITSEKFTGQAEIFYNDKGVLNKIDCTDTDMNEETITHFKRSVPANIDLVLSGSGFSPSTKVFEAKLEVTFQMFWIKYGQKINKKRALAEWNKLNEADEVAAYVGIDAYFKYLKGTGYRSKADPDKYIRNRYWENEYSNS